MSDKERAKLSSTKEKGGRSHTQVIKVIEDHEYSENGISILVKHKYKQNIKYTPPGYTWKSDSRKIRGTIEFSSKMLGKETDGFLKIATQGIQPPKIMDTYATLIV